jgi:hypothetical protein
MNSKSKQISKVFEPGPVQGPGSGFWPGHRVLAGSAGSIPILKKIQNGVVLVKKKKSQRVATRFLTGFCRVAGQPAGSHRVMAYAIFSSTRPGSSPGSTRRAGPGFKTLQIKKFNFQ